MGGTITRKWGGCTERSPKSFPLQENETQEDWIICPRSLVAKDEAQIRAQVDLCPNLSPFLHSIQPPHKSEKSWLDA